MIFLCDYVGKTIGFFRGFRIVPQAQEREKHSLKLVGAREYSDEVSDSDVGTIVRLENATDNLEAMLKIAGENKINE